MNVFSLAFGEMFRVKDTNPVRNMFVAASVSLTERACTPYMDVAIDRRMIDEGRVTPFTETAKGKIYETMARLLKEGLVDAIDITKYPKAAVEVFVRGGSREDGWNGETDSTKALILAADVRFTNGDDVVLYHRFSAMVGKEPQAPFQCVPALEWELVPFPTPDAQTEGSVVVVTRDDMLKMSTGRETIRDFACLAVKAGWNIVQIRANDIVLIK